MIIVFGERSTLRVDTGIPKRSLGTRKKRETRKNGVIKVE